MNNWRGALLLVVILLLLVVPVYAQETTPAVEPTPAATTTTEEQPLAGVAEQPGTETATGLPVLVLIVGICAIGAVGGITLLRENYKPPQAE